MNILMDIVIPNEEVITEASKEPSVFPAILVAAVAAVAVFLIVKAINRKK
ncbi:MAG: hypothetical protein IKK14_03960 [Oscillospiraceae bacterium]|nr:hypothetical protein [Oscillospiraceae bacterium]